MKAVILDMDGVMVDSEHKWRELEGPFLRGLLGKWDDEDHERIVGRNVKELHGFLSREYGLALEPEAFLAQCEEQAREIYTRRVTLAEGLIHTLEDLAANGVALAVASSSARNWIEVVLNRFDLGRHFQAVVSGDDAPGRAKPHPDIYLEAARRLGHAPADCVAVEDSAIGLAAARAAGMVCVAYRSGTNDAQDLSKARFEARGFSDLAYRRLISRLSLT